MEPSWGQSPPYPNTYGKHLPPFCTGDALYFGFGYPVSIPWDIRVHLSCVGCMLPEATVTWTAVHPRLAPQSTHSYNLSVRPTRRESDVLFCVLISHRKYTKLIRGECRAIIIFLLSFKFISSRYEQRLQPLHILPGWCTLNKLSFECQLPAFLQI